MATDYNTPVYVNENDFFRIRLPWSEVCMSMGVHDRVMTARLLPTNIPMVQLYDVSGHRFSSPITAPESGLFTDPVDGRLYGYGITDIADRPHGEGKTAVELLGEVAFPLTYPDGPDIFRGATWNER